jgi:hypothetical protein
MKLCFVKKCFQGVQATFLLASSGCTTCILQRRHDDISASYKGTVKKMKVRLGDDCNLNLVKQVALHTLSCCPSRLLGEGSLWFLNSSFLRFSRVGSERLKIVRSDFTLKSRLRRSQMAAVKQLACDAANISAVTNMLLIFSPYARCITRFRMPKRLAVRQSLTL